MDTETILFRMVFPMVLVGNVIWFFIKYVVQQNGYETHLFHSHFNDIANLRRLIAKEQDMNQKRFFTALLIAFYISIALVIAGFIWMVATR